MDTNQRLQKEIDRLIEVNSYRELKQKTNLIDFCSNDYLGLSQNPEILSQIAQIKIKKNGSGGSRLLAGNTKEIEAFESLLAKIHRKEAALVFNSGYTANLAFFSTVPSKESIVLYDSKIHACIKDGMRLSHAKRFSFAHNDLSALEKKMIQFAGNEIFVAVESVYSMDGDFAPLKEISQLCKKYCANLVVDEAHSTAVYGEKGAGLVTQLNLDDDVFAKIHTFGKAIGGHGAAILGNEGLKKYLVNKARPFIYTTALPSHDIEVLSLVYAYLQNNWKSLQEAIYFRIKLFRDNLAIDTPSSESPIQIVVIPGNTEVKRISSHLELHGFDVRPVLSPTVPKGEERLRVCLHNFNSQEEIVLLAKMINESL